MIRPTLRSHPTRLALVLALASGAAAAPVRAQDAAALVARREMIEQAQHARVAGDHARALDLAERAARIATNASVRLFIAQEHNALGHLADAYGEASRCAAEAGSDAQLPNRAAVLAVCRALANQLRARVARVTVRMPAVVPQGATVTVAGRALDEPLWGVAYPVTPGAVLVEARAPGHQPFRREVVLAAGGAEEVPVELAPDPRASVSDEAPTSGPGATPATTSEPIPTRTPLGAGATAGTNGGDATALETPPVAPALSPDTTAPRIEPVGPARDSSPSQQRRRVAAFALIGVGAGLAVLSVPLIIVRESVRADCPANSCPDATTLVRVRDTVYATTGVSIGLIVLGLASVTTGVVLLATAPARVEVAGADRAVSPPRRPRALLLLPHASLLPEGGALGGLAGRF